MQSMYIFKVDFAGSTLFSFDMIFILLTPSLGIFFSVATRYWW